jgi:hypothetical protein
VARKLDWESANREERVRSQGSERAAVDSSVSDMDAVLAARQRRARKAAKQKRKAEAKAKPAEAQLLPPTILGIPTANLRRRGKR